MDVESKGAAGRYSGLRAWFIRHSLLFPVIVMAGYFVGRGMGDALQLLYILGGFYTLKAMSFSSHRGVIYALVLLLMAFLLSALYPEILAKNLKYWLLYSLSSLTLVFTVGSPLQTRTTSGFHIIAWVPVVLLIGFATKLGYFYFFAKNFQPAVQVNGMILAALSPMVLVSINGQRVSRYCWTALYFSLAFVLLMAADSRTELLMLIMGGALFYVFINRKVRFLLFSIPVAIVLSIIADAVLYRDIAFQMNGDVFAWFDKLSTYRLRIWAEALTHPPENNLIGVGMHRSIEFLPQLGFVKHLHNLLIEIWYETGILGLSMYLLLIALLLRGIPAAYQSLQGMDRRIYSVFLASGMVAMIGALLDKGYYHPLARYYMLFCFTVLYLYHQWLQQQAGRDST